MSSADITDRELKIGPYSLHAVPTGKFGLDGGAMFGTVPRVLWQKTNPPDDQNRIAMEARALLLKGSERIVLIDTGNGADFIEKYGPKLGAKFAEIYAMEDSQTSLFNSLNKVEVKPEDVTDVILTHLHFDHAGGATTVRNGELVPSFPNARYYVQRDNLSTAQQPNIREKASYFPANFEPLLKAGVLEVLDFTTEVLPSIHLIRSDGHTTGHQLVKVSDGQQTLVFCGDVVPTSTHVRRAWVMGYDLHPLQLIEEKTRLLGQAARENWVLFFEHDPDCDAAYVREGTKDFEVSQRLRLI